MGEGQAGTMEVNQFIISKMDIPEHNTLCDIERCALTFNLLWSQR